MLQTRNYKDYTSDEKIVKTLQYPASRNIPETIAADNNDINIETAYSSSDKESR